MLDTGIITLPIVQLWIFYIQLSPTYLRLPNRYTINFYCEIVFDLFIIWACVALMAFAQAAANGSLHHAAIACYISFAVSLAVPKPVVRTTGFLLLINKVTFTIAYGFKL
jgi:hypothetical protein